MLSNIFSQKLPHTQKILFRIWWHWLSLFQDFYEIQPSLAFKKLNLGNPFAKARTVAQHITGHRSVVSEYIICSTDHRLVVSEYIICSRSVVKWISHRCDIHWDWPITSGILGIKSLVSKRNLFRFLQTRNDENPFCQVFPVFQFSANTWRNPAKNVGL